MSGRVGVVTGAGRGIGRAIAVKLSSMGASTVLVSRTESELEETAALCEEVGGRPQILPGDVRDPSTAKEAVSMALDSGGIDFLVNNAGVAHVGRVWEIDPGLAEEMVEVNLMGAFYMMREAIPHMLERGRGDVVNVISQLGKWTAPGWGMYSASKHALAALTATLREELAGTGVRVVGVYPGAVDTPLLRRLGRTRPGILSPDDVADAVAFVLSRRAGVMIYDVTILPG